MKKMLTRMWQSGIALLMALCLMVGVCPTVALAQETERKTTKYVSLGDSMTNGYCFTGYHQGEGKEYLDFYTGKGVYGDDAYPDQFAEWLTEQGYDVEHTKLAPSAMRAEDLNYLLGGREMPTDGWFDEILGYALDDKNLDRASELSEFYVKKVSEADLITMCVGNASFGAYMLHTVTDALGLFGASLDEEEKVNLEMALIDLEPEQKQLILEVYNQMKAEFGKYIPAEMAEQYNVYDICDVIAYTAAGFVLNYKGSLERIVELNPNAEIILIGLMNTTYGMKITADGMEDIPIGDIMDSVFSALNAYIAGLPTVMQAAGEWEDAKFYYAEQPNPLFISQQFAALKEADWKNVDGGRLSGETVRDRNIDAYNGSLREMVSQAFGELLNGATLPALSLQEVQMADLYGGVSNNSADYLKNISAQIYLGIEDAVAASTDTMDIPLTGLIKIATDLKGVFVDFKMPDSSEVSLRTALGEYLTSTDELKGMCKIYALFKVGNGMSVHPTPSGHDNIAKAVIAAYETNHTAKDETIENVEIVLNELYNLLETYGPEVAAQVWAQWEEYGYVDAVETTMSELKSMLENRYAYYTGTALPAITKSVENLSAQKDALTAELTALKAELEAKKAELAEVINNVEIGSIHTPDINIDVELGGNEQTRVPENDCVVDGEGIEAELEAAVRDLEHAIAVIEALIADIEADIADMVALAEQIAAAVGELEKTMSDVAAAAKDLEKAVNEVINVVKNSDGIVNQVVNSFEAARATAKAAVEVLNLIIDTAEEMMADVDVMIEKIATDAEALYNKFITELPGCIEQIPEEALMLMGGTIMAVQQAYEANKEEINANLQAELAKLAAEYGISEENIRTKLAELVAEYGISEESIRTKLAEMAEKYDISEENIRAELAEIEAKITEEVNAKYAEIKAEISTQIENKKAEAAKKLATLEEELKCYQAELQDLAADAAEEVRKQLQTQIDRVNADIATVNQDLACAVEHLENAAQEAYEQIVAEVTRMYEEAVAELEKQLEELKKAYEEAVAELEKQLEELKKAYDKAVAELEKQLAELKAAYDKAVEELIAAADKAIAELTEALNKLLEELGKIGEALADEVNGILTAIRKELAAAQKAVEEILKGNLEAIEELKNALLEMGGEAIVDAVESLIDAVMALIEEATTADLVIDDDFKYVAIGDGSAETESYVEKLAAALNAEAAENGVNEIELANYAKAGNTVAAERANLSDVAGADLITIGFSNVEFMAKAVNTALNGGEMDWAAVVGAENVQYVDELLAEVAAKIAETGIEGESAELVNSAIEAYAYAAMVYATELPGLINDIRAVNPDALVIIVGMYNPMDGVIIDLGGNATLDMGQYIDYLVKGAGVHGVAYSILSGNSIYVDAPSVATINTDKELGLRKLYAMINSGFADLYPSAVGDDYIAAEIADALNITYVKTEVRSLPGDVDMDGDVDGMDLLRLQKYLAGDSVEIDLKAADVYADEIVDGLDLLRLQKHLAGDNVTLG